MGDSEFYSDWSIPEVYPKAMMEHPDLKFWNVRCLEVYMNTLQIAKVVQSRQREKDDLEGGLVAAIPVCRPERSSKL